MKKIIETALFIMLMLSLGSCQLAVESTLLEVKDEMTYEVPFAVTMEIHEEPYLSLDLTEYLYASYVCEGENVNQDRSCSNYGKSVIGSLDTHVHTEYVNDELQDTTYTYTFDTKVYVGRELARKVVYSKLLFEDMDDHTIEERSSYGTRIGGASLTMNGTGTHPDGTLVEMVFKVEFVVVDELISVSFKEYDDDNELVRTTIIEEESDHRTIEVHQDTAYMLVEETYRNPDGKLSVERTLIEEGEYLAEERFHLKFLNDLDLVESDYVLIDFNREE